jgi:hypothetical protein
MIMVPTGSQHAHRHRDCSRSPVRLRTTVHGDSSAASTARQSIKVYNALARVLPTRPMDVPSIDGREQIGLSSSIWEIHDTRVRRKKAG